MPKNHNYNFVLNGKYIEARDKDGKFLNSICCIECVNELERLIKKLKEKKENDILSHPKGWSIQRN